MIAVVETDFVPLSQFALAWRFTDADWDDPALRRDVRPLRPERAAELLPRLTAACAAYHNGEHPPDVHIAAPCVNETDARRARLALEALPVDPGQRVLVQWDDRTAAETSWDTFVSQWKSFCYPGSDDATITPLDERWVLCYHHWEAFSFSRRADPAPPDPQPPG
jgi:hypothetical protein